MQDRAADIARRLADQAEAVCRHYLSNGRRAGNYWLVGDVHNTPGRSMFVRLKDTARGVAGKWTDAESGEHGDLLDVIRECCGLKAFADMVEEARRFLSLPHPDPVATHPKAVTSKAPAGSAQAARRLFAMSRPITDTLVETYLRGRGITALHGTANLRFHPNCYYRPEERGSTDAWPAMVAAVTDLNGRITGAHRTWLARDGTGKAPIATTRKAMGDLLGHAVRIGLRIGVPSDVMAAGEGIETMLSLRQVLPELVVAPALSAPHLAAILFPDTLRRLYIVRDNDRAGAWASDILIERANAAGIEAIILSPLLGDLNDDLRRLGPEALRAGVRAQLALPDVTRFMT